MKIKNRVALYVLGGMLLAILAAGAVYAQEQDLKGSMDHPMISRFPGTSIVRYDVKGLDEYALPLGKMEKGKLIKSQKLEGKVFQITYAAPQDRSILEIYRNYESALKKAGFEILFSGKSKDLGGKAWMAKLVDATTRTVPYGKAALGTHLEDTYSYMAAKLTRPEGDVYAALIVGGSWFQKYPMVQLDVIEVKPVK